MHGMGPIETFLGIPHKERTMRKARKARGAVHAEPRKADLHTLHQPGHYPDVEDRAAMRLARAIHGAESTGCATSWSAQERAESYYNEHGLSATLTECERLEALRLPDASN